MFFFRVSRCPETEYVTEFSYRDLYSASLPYPKSNSVIGLVFPQAVLQVKVILTYSRILNATDTLSRNRNNTSFRLELSGEHASKGLMSLRLVFFWGYRLKNLNNRRFSKK